MINKYNPKLFLLWLGNMDISMMLSPENVAKYIISYITKSFRDLSRTLREYIRDLNCNNRPTNSILSSVMTKLITATQMGIQEAICYIGNRKVLTCKSRKVVRIHMPRIEHVVGRRNSNNINRSLTEPGADIQHYLQRSRLIEDICLFRYLQLYTYVKNG